MDGIRAKEDIRAHALTLGFATVGFADAAANPLDAEHLSGYLDQGRHGDMTWMAANADRRAAPQALWPEARSIVVLGENYAPASDPLAGLARAGEGNVSVYAQGADYHDAVKKRLKALARFMAETQGGEVKVFVDTAPVMEKPLAARAGLGWQGRHTNLVSRRFGSWLFLGFVFTTLELPPDAPGRDHCGRCRACESACPTQALSGGRIEPRRCISYLTIEHKGHIPRSLRPLMGNRIYGCDDCLAVCPWNKFAAPTLLSAYAPRDRSNRLAVLARLDDGGFRAMFKGSPIKRIGRDRLVRNVMIAVGNSGDEDLAELATERLNDASALVRAAAAWAVRRLLPPRTAGKLAADRLACEEDGAVRAEWNDPERQG